MRDDTRMWKQQVATRAFLIPGSYTQLISTHFQVHCLLELCFVCCAACVTWERKASHKTRTFHVMRCFPLMFLLETRMSKRNWKCSQQSSFLDWQASIFVLLNFSFIRESIEFGCICDEFLKIWLKSFYFLREKLCFKYCINSNFPFLM